MRTLEVARHGKCQVLYLVRYTLGNSILLLTTITPVTPSSVAYNTPKSFTPGPLHFDSPHPMDADTPNPTDSCTQDSLRYLEDTTFNSGPPTTREWQGALCILHVILQCQAVTNHGLRKVSLHRSSKSLRNRTLSSWICPTLILLIQWMLTMPAALWKSLKSLIEVLWPKMMQ